MGSVLVVPFPRVVALWSVCVWCLSTPMPGIWPFLCLVLLDTTANSERPEVEAPGKKRPPGFTQVSC